MSIYIVKNERNEEVTAYTDAERANYIAEQLESATLQSYSIEKVEVEDGVEVD